MSDEASLEVGFAVNIEQLTAAASTIDSIFVGVADSAQAGGEGITSSLTAASESFSSLSAAAEEMASMTAEGAASAATALDIIPSASENAASSLSDIATAVDELPSAVDAAVSEVDAKIESVGTTAEETASKSQSSFSGFDLGGMVTSAGMGVIALQGLGNMAYQAGNSLLGPAMAAENTQASFSNLLGSTGAAADELGKLNTFAAQTQFKTQDIDNAAASMIAFKTPVQNIVPDLTAVGDALTAVGKGTPAEMQGVVNILGKIGVQGKLTQGDITQLGAHGIDAMSAIERGSGLSAAALADMIKKGTLPANQAIKDLTTGIEENPVYSGGMAKQAGTLSGQMSTLASNWDQTLAAFGSPVVKILEGQVGNLSTAISSKSFKDFAGTVGKDVTTAFKDIGTAVQNAGQFFDNPAFGKLATLLGGQLATGLKDLAKDFDSPSFGTFAKVLGTDVANALLTATTDIENIVSWTIKWHDPIVAVAAGLTVLFIPAMIKSGVESVIAGGKIAVSFVSNIVKTGVEGFQAAGKIGTWVVSTIASGVQASIAGLAIAKDWVVSVIATGVQSTIAGLAIAKDWVVNIIASGVQASIAGLAIAKDFVVSIVSAGVEAVTTGVAFTANLIPAILSFVAESLVAAATAIPGIIIGFGAWAIAAGTAALATLAVAGPFILIGLLVGAVVVGIVLAVQHWSQIQATVGNDIKAVMGGVGSFFSSVGHDIENIFTSIGHAAENVGAGIESAFKGGVNGVINGLNWLINAVDSFHVTVPPLVVAGVTVFGGVDLGLPSIADIPLMAKGGTVGPGQAFIAGDAGPELIYGGSSGASVFSNSQSAAMMNGGGGGTTHVHIHIGADEVASFLIDPIMNKVVKVIRAQGGQMRSI